MGGEPNSPNLTQPLPGETTPVQRLAPGSVLEDRYQIEEVVGSGGMGAVYRARDLHFSSVAKWVAVKEMVNLTDSREEVEMGQKNFEREANLLATLIHPAIPRIYDFFSQPSRSYLVMDFIFGKNLEKLLKDSVDFLPEEQIIRWGIDLCSVLDYLHNHQPEPIVFRDMKPSNIICNQHGQVVLVDFGIAKTFNAGQKGTVVGTEGYSPPEQYRGEISPLVDIYALGATLHHLATRKNPQLEPPFTFQERPIRDYNPDISVDLAKIIEKALEYNPENRFSSAREMKDALSKLISMTVEPKSPVSHRRPPKIMDGAQPLWSFECEDEIRGTPVESDGIVYVGSYDNNVYAIDGETGEFQWKYPTEGAIVGKPTIEESTLYLGSMDGSVYAVMAHNRKSIWSFPTSGPICSSPSISGRYLFIGSDDGCLYAINNESGVRLWKYNTGAPVRSTPATFENAVYFGNEAGDFYCLDFWGIQKWHFRAKRAITSSPFAGSALTVFSSMDTNVYAFDTRLGYEAWRHRLGKGSISSPCWGERMIYVGAVDGVIYCLDPQNGREIWTYQTEHQVTGSPLAVDQTIFCGSVDGYLYSLHARTGKLNWKYQTGGPITGSPVCSDTTLYVGSLDHKLYAFSL